MVHINKFKKSRQKPPQFSVPVAQHTILVIEQVSIDGVLSSRQVYKTVNPAEISQFNAVDFCLQNQIMIGSVEKLRPVTLGGDDPISFANKVSEFETTLVSVGTNE